MNPLLGIDKLLQTLCQNKAAGRWFIFIVIVTFAAGGVFYFVKKNTVSEVRTEDCSYFKEQNRDLLNAMLQIKSGLKTLNDAATNNAASPSAFTLKEKDDFMFASLIDTTKPQMRQQMQMQQRKIDNIIFQIDSILIRQRLDSIRRSQTKQRIS